MIDVLSNTLIYLLLIALGFFLRKKRILKEHAADTLMTLILNFTLPCLLINGSAGVELRAGMMAYLLIGIALNVVTLLVSYLLIHRKQTPVVTGAGMLAASGIDVGDFVLPFILTFFPGQGVMILCIFNIGNTIMNSGLNYAIAAKVASGDALHRGETFGIKELCKRLFSSVTFDAYLLILFMALTHLNWPAKVLEFTGVVGNANIFLVMVMIGLKLEFSLNKEDRALFFQILVARLLCGAVFAVLTIFLPLSDIAKIVLCTAYIGPSSALSNIFARKLGYKGAVVAQINVASIFTSMALITAILMYAL